MDSGRDGGEESKTNMFFKKETSRGKHISQIIRQVNTIRPG